VRKQDHINSITASSISSKTFVSIILLTPSKSYIELDILKDEVFPDVYGWSTSERRYVTLDTNGITTRRRMEALHGEKLLQTLSVAGCKMV
jgi:hypothetical protein